MSDFMKIVVTFAVAALTSAAVNVLLIKLNKRNDK